MWIVTVGSCVGYIIHIELTTDRVCASLKVISHMDSKPIRHQTHNRYTTHTVATLNHDINLFGVDRPGKWKALFFSLATLSVTVYTGLMSLIT